MVPDIRARRQCRIATACGSPLGGRRRGWRSEDRDGGRDHRHREPRHRVAAFEVGVRVGTIGGLPYSHRLGGGASESPREESGFVARAAILATSYKSKPSPSGHCVAGPRFGRVHRSAGVQRVEMTPNLPAARGHWLGSQKCQRLSPLASVPTLNSTTEDPMVSPSRMPNCAARFTSPTRVSS